MITMGTKFKKSMAMVIVAAMAFSIPIMPVYKAEKVEAAKVVPAEATSALNVEIHEEIEQALITVPDGVKADVIYYAVTTQAKLDKGSYPSASAYEAVKSEGQTYIDLSWVNRKKEQVLCVATGTAIEEIKPVTKTLKAQDTLIATYSGIISEEDEKELKKEGTNIVGDKDNGYYTFESYATGKKSDAKPISVDALDYRTLNGEWSKATNLEEQLRYYTAKGATLQMRVRPKDEKEGYEGNPAGKILNVKIKAKTKAPSVTVNYNDKEVSVPKGVQYSVDNGKNWNRVGDGSKKESVGFEVFGWNGTSEKTVYFRTEGTAKKSSSKVKYVTIKEEDTSFAALEAPVSGAAVIAELPAKGTGKLDVRYKIAYNKDSGLLFTNSTDKIYQVGLVKKTELNNATKKVGDKTILIATSGSSIVSKNAKNSDKKKKVTWTTVNAETATRACSATVKTKGIELKDYAILYRICDKNGTVVNSEVRVFDVPGIVKQSVKVLDADKKEITKIEITSGTAAASKNVTVTVSGSGITSLKSVYSAKVYTDKDCTKVTRDLTVTKSSTNEFKIASKTTTKLPIYYVVVTIEGTSTVLEVIVN